MKKPSKQEIMEAYLIDLQKDVANAEKIKQQLESLRTENWSLERRNSELTKGIAELEGREKKAKDKEEELNKRELELDEKQKSLRFAQDDSYQRQVKLTEELKNYEKMKADIDKKWKDVADREKAIDATEYDIEIEKGKLEQKLKIYRDKLKLDQ